MPRKTENLADKLLNFYDHEFVPDFMKDKLNNQFGSWNIDSVYKRLHEDSWLMQGKSGPLNFRKLRFDALVRVQIIVHEATAIGELQVLRQQDIEIADKTKNQIEQIKKFLDQIYPKDHLRSGFGAEYYDQAGKNTQERDQVLRSAIRFQEALSKYAEALKDTPKFDATNHLNNQFVKHINFYWEALLPDNPPVPAVRKYEFAWALWCDGRLRDFENIEGSGSGVEWMRGKFRRFVP